MAWLDDSGVTDLTADIKALADADYAAISHTHGTSDITNGVLGALYGGTGAAYVNPNRVFAGPSTGGATTPDWRALVANDLPDINNLNGYSEHVYDATISRVANRVLAAPNGSNGVATFRALVANDLPAHGAATATKSSATSTSTSNTKITLDSLTSTDSSLFSLSSGGIKLAKAGHVLVSATMYESGIASGNGGFACRIMKGSSLATPEVVAGFTTSSLMATASITPVLISVAANDVIYLYHRSTKSGSIPANTAKLTVQYVC